MLGERIIASQSSTCRLQPLPNPPAVNGPTHSDAYIAQPRVAHLPSRCHEHGGVHVADGDVPEVVRDVHPAEVHLRVEADVDLTPVREQCRDPGMEV